MAVMTTITFVLVGGVVCASETRENVGVQLSGVYYMQGGHGGMAGGRRGGMMGYGQGLLSFFDRWVQGRDSSNEKRNEDKKILREMIREKRRELASQARSKNPNHKKIEQTIKELNRLESKLDD